MGLSTHPTPAKSPTKGLLVSCSLASASAGANRRLSAPTLTPSNPESTYTLRVQAVAIIPPPLLILPSPETYPRLLFIVSAPPHCLQANGFCVLSSFSSCSRQENQSASGRSSPLRSIHQVVSPQRYSDTEKDFNICKLFCKGPEVLRLCGP